MAEKNSNTDMIQQPNFGGSFRRRKGSRCFGWAAVFFAIIANALLFVSINWVNSAPVKPPEQDQTVIELFTTQLPEMKSFPKTDLPPVEPDRITSTKPEPVLLNKTEQSIVRPRLTEWVPESLVKLPGVTMNISVSPSDISDNADAEIVDISVPPAVSPNHEEIDPSAPMDIGSVDNPPTKISGRSPTYPRWARFSKSDGTVTLRFVVGANGNVSNVKVRQIKGDRRFAEAAIRAVQKWRFKPAIDKGRPVAVWVIQTISFQFEGKKR